jgi:hypothetical protein
MMMRPKQHVPLVISILDNEPLWSVGPKVKTDQRILCPKCILSLDVASQSIFSLFGDFMTILNFQTLIIIFGHCVPIRNTYGFLKIKKLSKFNFQHIKLQKCLPRRFCHKVCKPKCVLEGIVS